MEELLQRLVGALAELSQKLSIEFKIGPEQLGNRKNVLPMGKQVKNMFRDPFAKQQHCFLMAGRAEVTPFAGESQKDFVLALLTLDPGKAFFRSPQPRYLSITSRTTSRKTPNLF